MGNVWSLRHLIGILFCIYSAQAVAQDREIFEIGGGVTFGGSLNGANERRISHGHAYLVPDAPGFVFGCIEDADRQMVLNYLVLIKHGATTTTTFERGDPHPAKSSGSSDGKVRLYNFRERIRFGECTLSFSYKAEAEAVNDHLIAEEMTFQGKRIDLADGRVFVVDMTAEPVKIAQVNVKLPVNPNLKFIEKPGEYKLNTSRWIEDLSKTSDIVARTFKK